MREALSLDSDPVKGLADRFAWDSQIFYTLLTYMLQISDLHKSFGLQKIFDGITLQMNSGERLGLVGRNGHGKTTLFRMILGQEEPDSGTITFPKNYRIGILEQHLKFTQKTVIEEGCLGLPPDEVDDFYKVEAILFGLGFTEEDMSRAPAEFSGGFQIRLNLAKVLVSKPNLLLLDEPTNYLDIISMRWLVEFLNAWQGEMIIISHDRDFMDAVTTHTAAIHRCKLKKVSGGTKKLYDQILQEEEIHEKTRLNDEKKRKGMEVFINRFKAKASKASVVQSRVKMMEKLPQLERLSEIESLDFEFRYQSSPAKVVLEVQNLTFGFDPEHPLIVDLHLMIQSKDRIAIIGKNGKGKSTLLNLMAGEMPPDTGEIKKHPQTKIGYFGQTNINRLSPHVSIEDEITHVNPQLGRTVVRNICGTMMFDGDKAEKKISVLSGGEKSRVMLGKILATPTNLLFLDEPTNHLDMESIQSLVESIQDYPGAVVIVTHSEMILREVATKLVIFHRGGVEVFPGDYDDFLEKVGWEEEAGKIKSKSKVKSESAAAAERKPKQEKEARRIQKEMENLEGRIIQLEESLKKKNDELVLASEKRDVAKIAALSREIQILQQDIDGAFSVLENLERKNSL